MNQKYWEVRSLARRAVYDRSAAQVVNVTKRAMSRSMATLKQEMDDILRVYAKRHSLSRKEALEMLHSPVDMATQQRLQAEIASITDPMARRVFQAAIEAPSYSARLTRAQAMQDRIVLESVKVADVEQEALKKHLTYTYMDGIDRFMYDASRGVGRMFDYSAPSIAKAQEVLRHRWAGGNYSARVWGNAKLMQRNLESALMENMLSGKTSQQTWDALMEAANGAITNAERLIRTETAYIAGQAEKQGYMAAGFDEYKFVARLEAKTCPVCGKLDGQKFPVKDAIAGKNLPPIHPWCRCTTEPWDDLQEAILDETDTRWAKDPETGEVIEVPMSMTYEEWKKSSEIGKLKEYMAEKSQLVKVTHEIHEKDADRVFHGIWKNDVTFADWQSKKGSIQAKRDYFNTAIDHAVNAGDTDKEKELRKHLDDLEFFENHGQENSELLKKRQEIEQRISDIASQFKQGVQKGPFDASAYSQARLDGALWAKKAKEADDALRPITGEVWRNASKQEKEAINEYTGSYHKFNEPLRGIEYGTNRYLGVGNTDLDAGHTHNGNRLNAMTDIIEKCTYKRDIWLQRGVGYGGMDKFFQCDPALLSSGTQKELEKELLDKIVTEYGFMSCGSSKGQGFASNPIILNIYAPTGTKMMYVEPFSKFGNGDGLSWDGQSTQSTFGHELETILQQGTRFRIAKITRASNYDTIYVDLYVIGNEQPQRYKK